MSIHYVPIPVSASTRERLISDKRRRSAEANDDWTYEQLIIWYMDVTNPLKLSERLATARKERKKRPPR